MSITDLLLVSARILLYSSTTQACVNPGSWIFSRSMSNRTILPKTLRTFTFTLSALLLVTWMSMVSARCLINSTSGASSPCCAAGRDPNTTRLLANNKNNAALKCRLHIVNLLISPTTMIRLVRTGTSPGRTASSNLATATHMPPHFGPLTLYGRQSIACEAFLPNVTTSFPHLVPFSSRTSAGRNPATISHLYSVGMLSMISFMVL
mmetsp:Transcript_36450/g.68680  ORF Transcript_36450/g.68680 Transcript_36450/m.68680 type:complete len:207 (+) Transcript_36450:199-819(+)